MLKIVTALGVLSAVTLSGTAFAAKLIAADRAWIDACISQRKASNEKPSKLRKYCACMQGVVENNQPFQSATDLERTYPPAHQMCWKDAGRT
ncbi:hypothetical protein YH63_012490 [Afipia massiliensis]|uniref:3',5'-cyclic-nucleotide phosphodiesterase n=1 Tax=Afipia massiliensis TaxID=211460 RepID=A0A4U6BP72_9BRAD|nr:hypothetical protein [Afipia massiliensis]TKT72172.1 hypothetical protein YH63_012490 [Afipia massiliensis]